uniref:Uncharacterized protein n=1 Tax=Oryza barthii TaxID=65489 RepID=A0A0D3H8B7_9ORYZ
MEQEDARRKMAAAAGERGQVVVLECVAGSSKAEEWGGGGGVVQEGDVVEAVRYVLRSLHDPNYVLGFVDRLESECLLLQGTRSTRVASALSRAQLQDGYVAYPWEKKMRDSLRMPNSSSYLSMLVLPKALDLNSCRYESFEDTLARANAWIYSSQVSGIPIEFMNVQSEALLTKISGETASATVNSGSLSDLSNVTNATLYGFEDYHGVDIGVVKAARLWYSSIAEEMPLEIPLEEGDTRLGFAISRTEEGFIFISSVVDNDKDNEAPSTRSGLRDLFNQAREASKLLVISRVSNEKVLPWMISSSGAIRCFDTISLSQKLSLHRLAVRPIQLHLLMWEKPSGPVERIIRSPKLPPQSELPQVPWNLIESIEPRVDVDEDYVGDLSFRIDDLSVGTSWV